MARAKGIKVITVPPSFPFGKQTMGTSLGHTGGGTIYGKRVSGKPNATAVRVKRGRR